MSAGYRLGHLKGQFVVVWEEDGRRRRYRLGTRDPREARSVLREFVKERERLERARTTQTIAEIWANYVADRKAEGKGSVGRMADAWKRLGPHFGSLLPDHISPDIVRAYTSERRGQGASDGTIHTELGYFRAALRRAGYSTRITLPPKPRPRGRYLTGEEAKKLIDAAQVPHVRLFVLLALYTAARPSSILDLTWDRVALARRVIRLDNPLRDKTAKGRATVPIAEKLIAPLEEAKAAALTEHVIEWAGRPVASVKKAIQRTAERGGLVGVTRSE